MSDENLTEQEKLLLLEIARKTIERYAREKKKPERLDDSQLSETLQSRRGAFVTLHKRGRLRGCIGTFEGEGRLADTIQSMAVSSGWHDPRFESLSKDELEDLDIEISVLTPLREIKNIEEIEVGKHGIYITSGMNRGVLLPQVATERGWDRETFLEQTCLKARLDREAWKRGAKIEVFSAEVFGEKDLD